MKSKKVHFTEKEVAAIRQSVFMTLLLGEALLDKQILTQEDVDKTIKRLTEEGRIGGIKIKTRPDPQESSDQPTPPETPQQ